MKTITITNTPEEGWTVTLTEPGMSRARETRCPHLGWDEMLGQIVAMTHHAIGKPHYPMLTDAEHAARDKARDDRMQAVHAEHRAEEDARAAAITAKPRRCACCSLEGIAAAAGTVRMSMSMQRLNVRANLDPTA